MQRERTGRVESTGYLLSAAIASESTARTHHLHPSPSRTLLGNEQTAGFLRWQAGETCRVGSAADRALWRFWAVGWLHRVCRLG